jgi:AsmA protein
VEGGLIPGGKLEQTAKGNLDLNWANKKGAVNLADLFVKLAGMEIKGSQVQLEPLAAKPSISGQFQTNTFNLKQVMKTLGITPPVTRNPIALSQLQAKFGLKADTDKADLQGLNIKLDKSTLSGSLGIANFTAPSAIPSLRPQLSINSINLDDYLAPSSTSTTSTAKQTKAAAQQELLPLDTLRKLNIDGSFKIGKMVINKIKMSNVSAKINARQGLIVIDPANASLYSGTYKGRITIDAKQATPTMKMRHEITGLRSEGLLFDLFQDKYISGGTKLITDLSSRGNSIDALLKNLNGTTSIAFNDGTIRDSNFAEKVSLAVKVFEKKELQDGKSVVKFTGLSGDWKTTNGVFKTDNLSMLSPFFNISGSGTADVANQTLNMKLRIGPNTKKGDKPLFAPLTITGTFSNPKFGLDLQDLIKTLAAQDIEKVKREAKQKLEQKKQEIQQKIAAEKAAQEQKLKQKLSNAKAEAIKKLKAKTGKQLGNTLLDKISGGSKAGNSVDSTAGKPAAAPKSAEDQVKDKLKNKLRGLF